ncbi:MAG: pyridoxal phosphate-dependent aminotransferase [Thermodesulfobacteriota bacterium]
MKLASRITAVKPSATLAVNAKAQEMRSKGQEIVSLAVGEPDFKTPEHIKEALKEALDRDFTRYTAVPGLAEVRESVAGYFNRHYGAGAKSGEVMISNGGKQCLYNLFQVLLDPGDEVLIPCPYWVSYPDMVVLAGGRPVPVISGAENEFSLSVDLLEKMVTPRTRLLILNSPSNPTGRCYTQDELEKFLNWARKRNIFVVSDEIYDQLVYAPNKPASLSRVWKKCADNLAVVNGLSKSFAMTGLRAGFVLADEELIKAMSKLQGQSTSNVCTAVQKGIQAALDGPEDFVREMRESLGRRRDKAWEMLKDWPGLVCPKPEGAFYLFPRVDGCLGDAWPGSVEICGRILEEAGVALVPGAAFGDDACLRISYAVSDAVLERALTQVRKVICSG